MACLFFYRHVGAKAPKGASIASGEQAPAPRIIKMIFLAKRFLILEILGILEILLQTIRIAGACPPRYVISGGF